MLTNSRSKPARRRADGAAPPVAHADVPAIAVGHHTTRSIYGLLRQDIVTLRLRPGERLSENELALRFGTSRAPVREALIRLVEDGLIDVRPQRGSFVSRISLQAMERARFVREALEVAIMRRAAEQGMPDAARIQAEAAINAQTDARDDPERFTQMDDLFHRSFAEGAALVGVWGIIEREKAQFDRIRILSLPAVTPVDVLIQQHKTILAAVLRRRPAAAAAAIRSHMSEVLRIADGLARRHPDLIVASD
jgi:GntR family transcriptional regulator, rspAB operon transcriptional repressor